MRRTFIGMLGIVAALAMTSMPALAEMPAGPDIFTLDQHQVSAQGECLQKSQGIAIEVTMLEAAPSCDLFAVDVADICAFGPTVTGMGLHQKLPDAVSASCNTLPMRSPPD